MLVLIKVQTGGSAVGRLTLIAQHGSLFEGDDPSLSLDLAGSRFQYPLCEWLTTGDGGLASD